jgi:hypothetical protein
MATVKKAAGGEAVPPLEVVLSDIAKRNLTLGKLDLKIVSAVKTLEEKLRGHLSTRVSTTIDASVEQGVEWCEVLTYGKLDGKWQFLIESGHTDDPDGWKTQPLASAAREKRIEVFTGGFLEKLVRGAAAHLEAQISEREKAIEIANSLIAAFAEHGVGDDHPF